MSASFTRASVSASSGAESAAREQQWPQTTVPVNGTVFGCFFEEELSPCSSSLLFSASTLALRLSTARATSLRPVARLLPFSSAWKSADSPRRAARSKK